MSEYNLRSVIVQKMFYSKRAHHKYRLARQRMPIGTIDLTGCDTLKELTQLWNETVGERGMFSLLVQNNHGRITKCIAVLTVDSNGLQLRDKRCVLSNMLTSEKNSHRRDMSI